MLNELSAYVEDHYKEIKEHGFYNYLTIDDNLLFNYRKGIYQRECCVSTALEFRSDIEYYGSVYSARDMLLDETDLLNCGMEELKQILDAIVERRLKMPGAQIPLSGEYAIMLKHDPASSFIHEAVGHLFEEDNFRRQSVFCEKTVSNPRVSVTDFAHTAFGRPCPLPVHIDSEGTETTDVALIKNGRVCGRMNNRYYAGEGYCSGNGRSSFFFETPLIRMRNTAFEIDKSLKMDMSALDNGLVVETTEGGASGQDGEIELLVEFGYEVKKGKITKHLRNFMVHGFALDLLNSIEGCGDDFTWHSSTCGKNGYGIRLAHGSPSILLKGSIHGV
jgi:TldD protein